MAVNKFGPMAMVYPNGAPLASKQIEVRRLSDGAIAPLFTTISGTVAAPNPTVTTALGMLTFFAEEGVYEIEVLESGYRMTVVVYPVDGSSPSELGEVKVQSTPSATWNFTHSLGRLPTVSAYLASGEEVETDIVATTIDVYVTWPVPTAGKLVLT